MTETTQLPTSTEEIITKFSREASVSTRYLQDKNLSAAELLANVLRPESMKLDEGQIMNPELTVALVFYEDDVKASFLKNYTSLSESAVEVSSGQWNSYDQSTFTFPTGNRAGIQREYVDLVEKVYGVDLLEEPERAKSHRKYSEYPIKVEDDESGTYLLIAPLAMGYGL